MKKFLLTITTAFVALFTMAQSPNLMNYQGVARNAVGNVIPNQQIALRLSILSGSASGSVVYSETRTVFTNAFGLFNVVLGSPGTLAQVGTVAGINWSGFPSGGASKFLQVEIDPQGGSNFTNVGSTQMVSVPYAINAGAAAPVGPAGGDLTGSYPNPQILIPLIKTQSVPASPMISMTNSSATGITGALLGVSASTDANAVAIQGTVSSTSPGGFSASLRGVNNGTGGLGIGVWGSQAGSGWGVFGQTPAGIGVYGSTTSGFGVYGGATSGVGVYGTSSTNTSGLFQNTNAANAIPNLAATTNGTGDNIQSIATGTGKAGVFNINNAANANFAIDASSNGTNNTINSGNSGTGRAGSFQTTNTATTSDAVLVATNSTSTIPAALHATSGSALITIGAKKGAWGESDNGVGFFGTSSSGIGTYGVTNTGAAGLAGFSFGAGAGITATSAGTGRAADFSLGAGNPSSVVNAVTAGTGRTVNIANTNAANIQITELLNNANTSSTGFGNGTLTSIRGAISANTYLFTGVPTGATGISSTGIGVQGTSETQFGVAGLTYDGTGVLGASINNGTAVIAQAFGAGYALQTAGKLQFTGQGAGANKVLGSDAAGNATWQTFAALGGVTGTGTLNNIAKWTPNGTNLGNSILFDDGTNVGVGNSTPAYRLDVQHAGATGAHIQSTGTFSVVDIDAANGDAALRLQKAGVGQWNIRNRPADDYLEIFELGGGGSRMVIQDATGNVGIGETTNPTYKLDVLHGGSTGIRSRSSSSFSVVDIDAASGDAALRFIANGVSQWNTRNRPADNYYEIFELGGGGSRVVIQDATGNVGIGETTNPVYKLDVLHGGGLGARVRSSSSFSALDIDGATGDAALRFAANGVNQWNLRNRPADNYFEIFELGGGGSRVVIQDATGNVGIGQTTNPTYKLDVLHGGATGIRSQSSSSFSVVDIDGQNGDAALRFVKAGVNQWNTRNNPATDDYQIFELGGGGERMRIENTTGKVVVDGDFTVLGVKAFTMDHPLDPENKLLMHVAAESNEVINFYSGNITTDASGKATVSLPDYFEAINKDYRYQLTVVGGTFAQAIISKEVSNNKFEIATNQPNVKVSWEVKGVRNDNRMKKNPFVAEQLKTPTQKGKYYDPASYNLPESRGISYDANLSSSLNDVKVSPAKPAKVESVKGTSVEDIAPVKAAKKVLDLSGSVMPVAPVKTAVKTPVETNSSINNTPIKSAVKPVENSNPTAKPVEVPATTATTPLISLPIGNNTGAGTLDPGTVANPNKMPEVIINPAKATPVEETKPVVTPKVPAVPMQKEKSKD